MELCLRQEIPMKRTIWRRQKEKNLPVRHCIRGTKWLQIRQEIADLLTEAPVDKETFGSRELVKSWSRSRRDFDREHHADRALYRYLRDLQCHAL